MSEYKEKTESVLTLKVVSVSMWMCCMQMCWCADADDCKEEKKRKDKKTKENLLNINLEWGWWDSGHGCADVLCANMDWLADECEESKKQQRKEKNTHWWPQMVNAGMQMCYVQTCWCVDALHMDGCNACDSVKKKEEKKDLLGWMWACGCVGMWMLKRWCRVWVAATSDEVHSTQGLLEAQGDSQRLRN